jgi:cyclopropane fatty-acyl-phospholipid synthase-like methyltransferase
VNINKQVEIMETQIHSRVANFTLMEKMQYLTEYFGNDPNFSKEAQDIVRSNICKKLKEK